jgi:hypothetical protein
VLLFAAVSRILARPREISALRGGKLLRPGTDLNRSGAPRSMKMGHYLFAVSL